MDFINAQKKTLPAECLITAVSGAVLFGGLLLYLDIPKLNFPYAALYWTGLFLCLFFIPKKWLIHCVLPVLQGWWGMDRKESHRLFFTAGISTLVSSLAAHGFLFTNEFFSHDSLSLMLSGPRRLGGLEFFTKGGRFVIPSYEGLRGNTTNSPWVVGLLFLIFMCLSAVFLVRLLDIQSTVGIALTSSLLCTSVTLSLTGATYVYAMDEYSNQYRSVAGRNLRHVCDVHQSLVHTDTPHNRRPPSVEQGAPYAAGQAAGQSVRVADRQHRKPGIPLGGKLQVISRPLSPAQPLYLRYPCFEGQHRTQLKRAVFRILLAAEHTVKRYPDPRIISTQLRIIHHCVAGEKMRLRTYASPAPERIKRPVKRLRLG